MTITTITNRVNTNGDGATTAFSFPYFVEDAGDLEVWLRSSVGAETLQTITTHYSLSGLGSASITVIMLTAPASGERLTMIRKEPHTNEISVDDVNSFRSQAFEDQFDRIARGAQRLEDEVGRSIRLKDTDLEDTTGVYDAQSRQIINVADGVDDNDAVNKSQLDAVSPGGGGGLDNVVEDTTPQLGGDLDANGFDILIDTDFNLLFFGSNPRIKFDASAYTSYHRINAELAHIIDGSTVWQVNASGVKLGGAAARVNEYSTDGNFTNNSDTAVPTEKAVKTYVDASNTSQVTHEGGYNATTNTPDLDTSPSALIKKGWMYTVTAAGTFFTAGVEVGDVLIANQDAPTAESHWTIVNKNLDAASIKVAYESNADTNEFSDAEQTKLGNISAFGETLIDDAAASNARTTLELGSSAILAETTYAEYLANTADKVLSTDQVWTAATELTLSDAATITVNMSLFINAKVTLAGNRTLGNPTGEKVGQTGFIRVIQDATGSRTLSFGTDYEFAGGTAPTLTTTANAEDLLFYCVLASNRVFISNALDIS